MIKNNKNFDRVLSEAVRKSIRQALNEYEDYDMMPDETPFDDSGFEDDDYLNKIDRENKAMGFDGYKMSGAAKPQDFTQGEGDADAFFSELMGDEENYDSTTLNGVETEDDPLYKDAMDAMVELGGEVNFNEWFSGLEDGTDRNEAKAAFDRAKHDFENEEGEEEDATEFQNRPMAQQQPETTDAGDETSYDGIEITKDGDQYSMVANVSNPEITIKGSNLNDVKKTYDYLWRDVAGMEDRARKMGLTVWHGAMLWDNDYDSYVRSAGAHEDNLPVVIDLDKLAMRGKKVVPTASQTSTDSDGSWLEPYKHANGKYMLTNYQLSKLSPEQRAEWEKLKEKNPAVYTAYAEAPSEKKVSRYKK